jgi:predicted outer membrane lipoprotein
MTDPEAAQSIGKLYRLTIAFGVVGCLAYLVARGPAVALAFTLGAAASFGNLWIFERLTHWIAPIDAPRKRWEAGIFVIRYILLLGIGYVIVNTLGVNPFAFIVGLFANAAAVLTSLIWELSQTLFKRSPKL